MDIEQIYPLLRSAWTVWFALLFAGIVAWALWPSRKAAFEEHGRIPLQDDR